MPKIEMLSTISTTPVVIKTVTRGRCYCGKNAAITFQQPSSYGYFIRAHHVCECGQEFDRTYMPARFVDD